MISESQEAWEYGAGKEEKKGIEEAAAAIQELKVAGLDASVVVSFYHQRRFAPLMAHDIPMFQVTLEERRPGVNVMAAGLVSDEEEEGVRAAVGPHHTTWPMVERPGMLRGNDCLEVVRTLSP